MIKMNRYFFVIGFLCALSLNANAAPRTVNAAMNEANNFLSRSLALRADANVQLAYTCPENAYYVFDRPDGEGFVVISGDDRAQTVLGYTESGCFDFLSLSDNFKYWLSCYEKELITLKEQVYLSEPIQQNPKTVFQTDFLFSITPLISTLWSQDAPYNNLCPVIPTGKPGAGAKTVTGCVATAMAQIMKYYEWPATYFFAKFYSTSTLKININERFNGTYDWANMTNSYLYSSVDNPTNR